MKEFYEDYWKFKMKAGRRITGQKLRPTDRYVLASSMINVKPGIRVLDVGCGAGGFGQVLRRQFGDSIVLYGVDISETALELAAHLYDQIWQLDIECNEIHQYLDDLFDYIVCLEVLEHLFLPEQLLTKLISLLRDDGYFILSFPNFAFWRYRINVLTGHFPSQQTQYRAAEHLHYWTLPSFKKMLKAVGIEVVQQEFDFAFPPLLRLMPFCLQRQIAHVFPNLFGIQIVLKGKVIDSST